MLYLNSGISPAVEWNDFPLTSNTAPQVLRLKLRSIWVPLAMRRRDNAPVLQTGPWEQMQQWCRGHTGPVLQRREAEVNVHDTAQTMKAQQSIKSPHTGVTGWLASPQQGQNRVSLMHLLQFLTLDRNAFTELCWLLFGVILYWLTDKFKDRGCSPKRYL